MDIHTLLVFERIIENIDDAQEIKKIINNLVQKEEQEYIEWLKEQGEEYL